jgi:hypothetical protein
MTHADWDHPEFPYHSLCAHDTGLFDTGRNYCKTGLFDTGRNYCKHEPSFAPRMCDELPGQAM